MEVQTQTLLPYYNAQSLLLLPSWKMSHLPLLVEVHFFLEMSNIVLIIGVLVDVVAMLPTMARAFFFSNLYYTWVAMNYDHVYNWHNEWGNGPTWFQNQALECDHVR
jgi:hypothetical protein